MPFDTMNISATSLLTLPLGNYVTVNRTEEPGGDFAALLKNAMENRKSLVDPVDTFECTSESRPPSTRDAASHAHRLDANGQPFDAVTRTAQDEEEFRKVFHQFVGQTMYGQMLKSMRETQQKPAYFHGGRTEEIFQEQLDNVLVEKLTAATPHSFSDNMFNMMK